MLLKINNTTTLSTGQTATAPVVEIFNDVPKPALGVVIGDFRVWSSQAHKDAGKDFTYLFHAVDSMRATNFSQEIPPADLAQAATDGHFGVIGQNYVDYVKDALAVIAGCDATDIDLVSLV